ncbi:hypothetical protein PAHAL_5G285500 [Panicum hallii]|uniref:Uncharacterized protein n=1 Tax=Panicum hallii TaxID=206008 RepID=A0A2S3HV46_9POAL|nr:hypothetical protein PAHAL_5G285500 [Panicum hallii]
MTQYITISRLLPSPACLPFLPERSSWPGGKKRNIKREIFLLIFLEAPTLLEGITTVSERDGSPLSNPTSTPLPPGIQTGIALHTWAVNNSKSKSSSKK